MSIDLEAMKRRTVFLSPDHVKLSIEDFQHLVTEVEGLRKDVRECEGFLHAQDGENLRLASEVKRLTAELELYTRDGGSDPDEWITDCCAHPRRLDCDCPCHNVEAGSKG